MCVGFAVKNEDYSQLTRQVNHIAGFFLVSVGPRLRGVFFPVTFHSGLPASPSIALFILHFPSSFFPFSPTTSAQHHASTKSLRAHSSRCEHSISVFPPFVP